MSVFPRACIDYTLYRCIYLFSHPYHVCAYSSSLLTFTPSTGLLPALDHERFVTLCDSFLAKEKSEDEQGIERRAEPALRSQIQSDPVLAAFDVGHWS